MKHIIGYFKNKTVQFLLALFISIITIFIGGGEKNTFLLTVGLVMFILTITITVYISEENDKQDLR